MDCSKLHVITMISNPVRYRSRYRLYEEFRQHMEDAGVTLHTVEVAFGDRPHVIHGRNVLHLRTNSELWHKENALNLLVERLPDDWQYVAWVDADVQFTNWRGDKAWYRETVHALQHHRIVQLFQNAVDLGPDDQIIQIHQGFAYNYVTGQQWKEPYRGNTWHPGFAWAMRRRTWDDTGGLVDFAILGAADNHMAHAWVGKVRESANENVGSPYFRRLEAYQARCEHFLKRDIGFVPGTIMHKWHGKKRDRNYWGRWRILVEAGFDPDMDIKRDFQGLYALTDLGDARSIMLRDKIRQYFRSRQEDSIDLV